MGKDEIMIRYIVELALLLTTILAFTVIYIDRKGDKD